LSRDLFPEFQTWVISIPAIGWVRSTVYPMISRMTKQYVIAVLVALRQ